MRLVIAAIGHMKSGPERELFARYAERIAASGKAVGLGPLTVREFEESRAKRADDRKAEEAKLLLGALENGARAIALDERGKTPGSEQFTRTLADLRADGAKSLVFFIGGADGLDACVRAASAATISFGAMTLPHQLVRVILSEQVYRATTILSGHPYHRA
jgi:23S rRNA (pseudouridine1915-N3)-methyltransferase